jgi:hypothetical protein
MVQKYKEYNDNWRKINPDKVKEAKQRYYLKNRDKILTKERERQTLLLSDPLLREQYNEKWRQYTRDNYEKRLLSSIKSKCKSSNIPFNLELTDIVIPMYCPKTGIPLVIHKERGKFYDTPSIDRVIPELGYIKGNVQVVCLWYNISKLTFTEEKVLELCKAVVANSLDI